MKNFYKLKNGQKEAVIGKLVENYGLPSINSNLSIYYRNDVITLEITFLNNVCYSRFYNSNLVKDKMLVNYFDSTPPLYIENKNIKYLFKAINSYGLNKAIVSRIIKLDFKNKDGQTATLQLDTIVGDLLHFSNDQEQSNFSSFFEDTISSQEIDKKINVLDIKPDDVFDKLGNINPLIKEHSEIYGINLSLNDLTTETTQYFKSNDYSHLDKYYKTILSNSLISAEQNKYIEKFFEPVSLIVPCYNSSKSILKVLNSIQSQSLSEMNKKQIEVILVDDGSRERVVNFINPLDFSFELKMVRMEQNMGLSNARNVGASISKNKFLIFIDSDILLSANYIYEHVLRLKMIPDSIFMSLKNNISEDDKICDIENIQNGLDIPVEFNDKRLIRKQDKNAIWVNEVSTDGIFEILSETKYFANFGNGRKINGFDLPSVVVGHNLSMTKDVFENTGGFSKDFSGWGLEDTLFGAEAIAKGYFVIPIVNTGVYHIDHPSRSMSEESKMKEYVHNIDIYKKLIKKKI